MGQTRQMTGPPVLLEVTDSIATVTLNRPEALNSLDLATKALLRETVRSVAADDSIRCLVLTGAGRAFCVGQDLKEHAGLLDSVGPAGVFATVVEHYNPIVATLTSMNKPVIAAVNGVAAGAGASLAFACDLRIAGASAGFNLAFAGVGLSCDTGSSWTLPRLVGPARALEMLWLPRTIPAGEADTLGLVNRVVPDEDLGPVAAELATRLAHGPGDALAAIKQAVRFAAEHSFDESLAFEADLMHHTGASSDHAEAVAAFLEKRAPRWGSGPS